MWLAPLHTRGAGRNIAVLLASWAAPVEGRDAGRVARAGLAPTPAPAAESLLVMHAVGAESAPAFAGCS